MPKTETGMTEAYEWRGRNAVDPEGEKIGKIDEIYLDQETRRPEWALVSTGRFGTKSNFVPLAGATPTGEDVQRRKGSGGDDAMTRSEEELHVGTSQKERGRARLVKCREAHRPEGAGPTREGHRDRRGADLGGGAEGAHRRRGRR